MLKDLVIPIGVVGILVSMVVPLTPGLLDFLLVANLLGALLLLISTLSISEPLKLSALPTILLLATLFRLALNVSTTRLILGAGDAGRAVEAFGHIVIRGNLVVGAVIFLLITLIQFIVIAKGSERVAEVSARFTLDALPGKQMSIDADVRAGSIDFETARQKRLELQIESRFYGALDGAMKFVKGDAIAGIIITAINIIGGLAIGLVGRGLTFAQAASTYTLLTVGDGLLSQIPALLNALAAGMVVTRVSRGDGVTLARELLTQMGQLRGPKVLIASVAVLLAAVPEMPSLPFLGLAAVLLASAAFRPDDGVTPPPRLRFEPRIPPLWEVSFAAVGDDDGVMAVQRSALDEARGRIFECCGLILPSPEIRGAGGRCRFLLRGVSVHEVEELPLERLSAEFETCAARHVLECVDDVMTRRILDFAEREAPELAAAVVPGIVSITQLTEVLKGLLREGVSVKNFDSILQAVAEAGVKAPNERMLLQEVRVGLSRVISAKFASVNGGVSAIALDPLLDVALARAEREGKPLDPALVEYVGRECRRAGETAGVVLIASKGARGLVRDIARAHKVELPVLAWEEIAAGVGCEVVGDLKVHDEAWSEKIIEDLAA